jgi:NADPH-dependent 2,4-dienoyl-CoA reductase/sulfur reductase-like enzyme
MTMIGLSDRVAIAGGGLAAVLTAQALRELQHRGSIVMLSDEDQLPYDRPPLPKILHGKADAEPIIEDYYFWSDQHGARKSRPALIQTFFHW